MKYTLTLLLTTMFMSVNAQGQRGESFSFEDCTKYTYGFIHIKDSTRNIAPIYCGAGNFSEGLAPVKKEGKWGFIDSRNREVIAPWYDYARNFSRGQAIVQQGEFYGVVNPQGEFVIPPCYYDLKPYELEGKHYYISRDSTFFAGIIDDNGNEVLPHQYTYVMELEGFVTLGSPRLYKHIPFYTTYREIDTAKGSFYAQFSENAFEFALEKGRQDYYDEQFNPVASREVASYADVFSGEELTRIDTWLGDHQGLGAAAKRTAIRALLESPVTTTTPSKHTGAVSDGVPASEAEFDAYMTGMGYERYADNHGKWGVKKDGEILLPAQFDILKWWGMPLFPPPKVNLDYLKKHFAGVYRAGRKDLFLIFGIAAGNKEAGMLYTMDGTAVIDLTGRRPEKATPGGFVYHTIERSTTGDTRHRFGFVNWKGEEVLPPDYARIQLLDGHRLLAKREKETARGTEEHVGLYAPTGEVLIPEGVFSTIDGIPEAPDLFLAEWAGPYPTKVEQKPRETKNRHFVLLNVSGKDYSVIQQFTASMVYTRLLNPETGLLKYRHIVEKSQQEEP